MSAPKSATSASKSLFSCGSGDRDEPFDTLASGPKDWHVCRNIRHESVMSMLFSSLKFAQLLLHWVFEAISHFDPGKNVNAHSVGAHAPCMCIHMCICVIDQHPNPAERARCSLAKERQSMIMRLAARTLPSAWQHMQGSPSQDNLCFDPGHHGHLQMQTLVTSLSRHQQIPWSLFVCVCTGWDRGAQGSWGERVSWSCCGKWACSPYPADIWMALVNMTKMRSATAGIWSSCVDFLQILGHVLLFWMHP